MDAKKTTVLLGLAFLVFLALSYVVNVIFFSILGDVFSNQILAFDIFFMQVGMLFIHNVLVVSLILLGMTFYVNLVIRLFQEGKVCGYCA